MSTDSSTPRSPRGGRSRLKRLLLANRIVAFTLLSVTFGAGIAWSKSYFGYFFSPPGVLRDVDSVTKVNTAVAIATAPDDNGDRVFELKGEEWAPRGKPNIRWVGADDQLIAELRARGLLSGPLATTLPALPPIMPLLQESGLLAEADTGYDGDDWLHGYLVDAEDATGRRLVFVALASGELSNDHFAQYEAVFGGSERSEGLDYLRGQRYFWDSAGMEDFTWYVVWIYLASFTLPVGLGLTNIVMLCRYGYQSLKRRSRARRDGCTQCGYARTGEDSRECPECGHKEPRLDPIPVRRDPRRWPRKVLVPLALLVGLGFTGAATSLWFVGWGGVSWSVSGEYAIHPQGDRLSVRPKRGPKAQAEPAAVATLRVGRSVSNGFFRTGESLRFQVVMEPDAEVGLDQTALDAAVAASIHAALPHVPESFAREMATDVPIGSWVSRPGPQDQTAARGALVRLTMPLVALVTVLASGRVSVLILRARHRRAEFRQRRARGQCAACARPMDSLAECPECGASPEEPEAGRPLAAWIIVLVAGPIVLGPVLVVRALYTLIAY